MSATPTAERYAATPVSLEDLLADPEIDLVVNLTGLPQHFAINKAALEAGKHVYSEKPLAGTYAEARELLDLAADRGLRVGCAPDTLLGGGHQAAKAVIDEGLIGTPVTAAAFLGLKAVEQFVPDPAAYFSWDAVVLDIGPYYVSQLVMMLGPVAEVTARGIVGQEGRDYPVRRADHGRGDPRLRVRRPGHAHPEPRRVAAQPPAARDLRDARHAGAARPQLLRRRAAGVCVGKGPWETVPLGDRPWSEPNFELPFGTFANYRGAGVEDLVEAIVEDRPHRASGELAAHVLDVLERILEECHAH